ncbi:translation initiation factor IF-2 [uncultured Paludibacter sp.]|nr:translation initiation factor IF-2 [uncultured Paludibacter sp.]
MSIRLSKVIKDLNVGLSTAVDYLAKKGHKVPSDINFKITEEEYLLLAKEFNKDMALKLESERLSQERQFKEKGETIAIEGYEKKKPEKKDDFIKTEVDTDFRPHITEVGHIELEKPKPAEKPKAEEKATPKKEEEEKLVTTETKIAQPEEKEQPKTVDTPKQEEPKKEFIPEKKQEEKVQISGVDDKKEEKKIEFKPKPVEKPIVVKPEIDENEKNEEQEKVFRLGKPKINIKPVVVGAIDLDNLNQSTRPKSKTKEQKKKEREERNKAFAENKLKKGEGAKAGDKPSGTNEHENRSGKRKRIDKKRIDITKTETFDNSKKGGKKEHFKKPIKTVVDEEEVQKQIKETLARLSGAGKKSKGSKYRREKRENIRTNLQEQAEMERSESNVLKLTEFVTVSELATMMNVSVNQVIGTCMSIGMMVSINQRLDAETINIVADEFGFKTEYVSSDVVEALTDAGEDTEEDLKPRAPIVTVMGHVDHGKTSLLDYIRKTNVIAGEAGGITQHIGAYNVKLENGERITFLDTPGHEAFTAMRARGAKVTDIAIIIVAADDNVMPQTIEAINHASAANVPIIFAINKVDKPGANPEKIKETLASMNYLVEDWGGKYQSQDISAKQGTGVNELLEKVLLEAEMLDLKANPDRKAIGSIIESSLDKGRGYVATVLIENGTLRMGDIVLAGINWGKIKAMFNERNQRITEAKPGEPVIILGLNGAPQAGDNFNVVESEHEARDITNKREQLQREQSLRTKKHFTLDELGRRIALGDFKELNIIVKGDVDGSIEALSDSLLKLSTEHIQVNVIHKAVGAISDSDILLAAASNAIIVGFQVRPSATARKLAEKEEIDIRLYSIIYDAIEEIKAAMEGMLSPEIKEEITATIEVREVFKITKVGTVAGAIVREGKIKRTNKVRLIRDGIVVYTGDIDALKRFKEDVKEVGTNFECGISIKNYNDIKVGDIIEGFEEVEIKQTL